jgi:hypothetical protein
VQIGDRGRVERRGAGPEADLRQARARADLHREARRRDLGEKGAGIAGGHLVEELRAVRDHAGEDVEPPRRALRVAGGRYIGGDREALQQGDDVDAARFQHGPVDQGELVQRDVAEPLAHRAPAARQEARLDPVGDRAEAQVEARGLDLPGDGRGIENEFAPRDQVADGLGGEDAGGTGHARAVADRRAACVPARAAPTCAASGAKRRGDTMDEIIARIAGAAGIDTGIAGKAVGMILSFLKKEGPAGPVGQMMAAFPGAEALMASSAPTGLGAMMGGMGGVMGLGGQLMGAGLSMPQMSAVGKELFAVGAEKAGPEVMGQIVSAVPGLSQFV